MSGLEDKNLEIKKRTRQPISAYGILNIDSLCVAQYMVERAHLHVCLCVHIFACIFVCAGFLCMLLKPVGHFDWW